MKTAVYPLPMDDELSSLVRQAAKISGLSLAEVMRQSIKVGLPQVTEALAVKAGRLTLVEPIPDEEWERIYAKPDDDAAETAYWMGKQTRRAES